MPKADGAAKAPAKQVVASSSGVQTGISTDNIEDWFVTLDDTVDKLNALFYGREGSYKTTGAATMANLPDKGRVLFINAEGGLKKAPLQKRGVDTSRIVVFPDPKKKQRVTHKNLDALYRKVKADLEKDPDSWVGVVIDSATEVHTALLDLVQSKRVRTLQNKGADVDEDFVDISDYGTMTKMFRDLLRKFRDLDCHFVVTALERRDVDKDTGKPQYGPAVTPGLQTDLLGYVDFVLMFKAEDEDGPGRALTRANSRYRAKDRFDVLPRVLANPTFERIMGYVDGTITEENDPCQAELPVKATKAQDKPDEPPTPEDDNADADAA